MKQIEIPEKLYFKIGEVAQLAEVEPYVLRYWETEFREICPSKSRTNQRLYRRKDVETILTIRRLLYDEKFTIEGARQRIREISKSDKDPPIPDQTLFPFQNGDTGKFLRSLREGLGELVKILEE